MNYILHFINIILLLLVRPRVKVGNPNENARDNASCCGHVTEISSNNVENYSENSRNNASLTVNTNPSLVQVTK